MHTAHTVGTIKGKTVWKYVLKQDTTTVDIPEDSKFLSVQIQGGEPVMWWEVDPNKTKYTYHFAIVGTGWENSVYPNYNYLGTFQVMGGAFVFHLYEVLAWA